MAPRTAQSHPAVTFSLTNPDPNDQNPHQRNLDLSGDPPLSLPADTVVNIVPKFSNPPQGDIHYNWVFSTGEQLNFTRDANGGRITVGALYGRPGTMTYTMHASWQGGGITASYTINWVTPS